MLTGLERFVRLVVERESLVPRSAAPVSLNNSADKSPKVCWVLVASSRREKEADQKNRFKKIKSLDLIRSKNSKKNNKLFDKNSKPKIGNQW